MKDAWLDTCSTTIQDFVERSTRLQPDNLDLELVEKIDFDYQINLSLHFRVETTDHTQVGRVSAGSGTRVLPVLSSTPRLSRLKPALSYPVQKPFVKLRRWCFPTLTVHLKKITKSTPILRASV